MSATHTITIYSAERAWLPPVAEIGRLFDDRVDEQWDNVRGPEISGDPVKIVTRGDAWCHVLEFTTKREHDLGDFAEELTLAYPGTYVHIAVEWDSQDVDEPGAEAAEYVAGRRTRRWEMRLVEVDERGKVKR